MSAFVVTRKIDLPLQKVWSICGDFTKSPGPGITVQVEEKGNTANNNVGAIRTITIGTVRVRESLEAVRPQQSFTYKILSGAPMKDHIAIAEFIPRGSSTEIRWNVEFKPKVPGIGWIVGMVTKKAINQYIDEIEKAGR